jgi:AcrR family transcriptional regulator
MTKKENILKAAARLFANQGFDGTTTLQIASEAGVTEPLIYYHFTGKDEVFTSILKAGFDKYYARLQELENKGGSAFSRVERLITLHFSVVDEMPAEAFLIISACPAKLNDPEHLCRKIVEKQQKWVAAYLRRCIKEGIESGEFVSMPITPSVDALIAMINGAMRRRVLKLEQSKTVREAAIAFCKRAMCA